MFASEMIDKSTVVGAGDDDPADLTFADGANVAVISGCTVWLADVVRLRARWSRGVSRSDAATNECLVAHVFGITVPPRLAGCRMRSEAFCHTSGIERHD